MSTDSYPYISVDVDGAARELTAQEREYLETEFEGADGGRPYIKSTYEQRNGWGDLAGYLLRRDLPTGTRVRAAPIEAPRTVTHLEALRTVLREHGYMVAESDDGTLTASRTGEKTFKIDKPPA